MAQVPKRRGSTNETHSPVDYRNITIGGTDVDVLATYGQRAYGFHANASGTVYLKNFEDQTYVPFDCIEGCPVIAQFSHVGSTVEGSSAIVIVLLFPERIR